MRSTFTSAILALTLSLAPTLSAQDAPISPSLVPATEGVLEEGINIPEGPIDSALGLIEILTGRTVLRAQTLPQTPFSLIINQPVTHTEALMAIETTLALNGIAAAPLGERFVKVVPIGSVRIESPELIEGSTLNLPPSGRIATKLFVFEFVQVGTFGGKIASLLNPQIGGGAMPFEQANAMLITDSITTLQRIELLVNQLDKPNVASLDPKFYPLVYAKASDLANKMRTILQGPAAQQLGTATTFNADDRTNQIIVISDARLHPFFDKLIARLDVRSDPNTRNEIIYLKHAEATEVASLVSNLVSGQNQATSRSESAPRRNGNTVQPATIQPATPANNAVAAALAGGVNSSEFSQLVTILPDERSNAVVVSGTVEDIRLIKELINKIDVLLPQVRIEVVIAEVTLSDRESTGISQLGLLVQNGRLVGFNAGASGVSVAGSGLSVQDPDFGDFASEDFALLSNETLSGIVSLGTTPRKSDAEFLQVPAVVTTHNKEAEFFVGQDIPVLGSFIPDAAGANTVTSTAYRTTVNNRQVGIRLLVKPLIGNNGSVQLEIEQSVEDVIRTTEIDGNEQPVVGQREMKSFISVQDKDIIVIGGLQRGNNQRTTNRFGPLPFIGDLLGSRTRTDEKTDLIFFLRPTILNPGAMGTEEAMKRVDRMSNAEEVHRVLDQEPLVEGK
ncbi:MAG: type II secretion system secretin GspD [Synoicihabitans sp.]